MGLTGSISKLGVAFLLCFVWIWREFSWSNHSKALESSRAELREVLSNVYSIAIASNNEVVSTCGEASAVNTLNNMTSVFAPSISKIIVELQRTPYIIDFFALKAKQTMNYFVFRGAWDWLVIALMISVMQFEIHVCHDKKSHETRQATISNKYLSRHLHLFYSRGYPLSNLIFFAFILVLSCVAWIGIGIDREIFTKRLLRILIFWFIALILSSVVDNVQNMFPYLPQTSDEVLEKVRSRTFWLWLIPRMFITGPGMDILSLGYSATSTFFYILQIWPLRYFYVNQEISCGSTARHADVFLARMLIHLSFLAICYSYFSMNVVGFPTCLRGYNRPSTHMSAAAVTVSTVLCVCSALWFALFSSGCGWWAAFVSMGFLIPQVMGVLTLAMTVSSLIHRQHNYWINIRTGFVDSYVQLRMAHYSEPPAVIVTENNNEASQKQSDAPIEEVNALRYAEARSFMIQGLVHEGQHLFDETMDQACRLNLWLPSEAANAENESADLDKSSLIFQCAFEDALKVKLAECAAERPVTEGPEAQKVK